MIVMLAGAGESTRILYHALSRQLEIGKVVIEEPVPRSQLLRRRVKKLGAVKVAGQLAFKALIVPALAAASRGRVAEIKAQFALDDGPIDPARVIQVPSVNDPGTASLLRGLRASVVVVTGTRIISANILRDVGAPFVNIHVGITPAYRGVHGAYWALVNRDPRRCGVTVHRVDEGIDTGAVIARATILATSRDNFVTYPYLQIAAGIPLLVDAVRDLAAGETPRVAAGAGESRLFTHPTLGEYLYYRLTRGVR